MSNAWESKAADMFLPPTDEGPQALKVVVAGAAALLDLNSAWGTDNYANRLRKKGSGGQIAGVSWAYFTLRAQGGDIYVRFRKEATPGGGTTGVTAGTTTTNGLLIADGNGGEKSFLVSGLFPIIDFLGTGSLKVWMSSPGT